MAASAVARTMPTQIGVACSYLLSMIRETSWLLDNYQIANNVNCIRITTRKKLQGIETFAVMVGISFDMR
ncbi:unnamed protein product [Fusarium graminearum]|uniref:Chromosome 1, complete genome n=2 Tax=Gibberella zeae TaxID=5518 RepID=A0A098D3P1_GIBZE|nr:unnamed protein product [Fusarium graminearum]CAF3589387.1 unnamed protein product [Fusarium graminearum]CAG1963227.1 unnamed protein product [Fusarium graminearum]CAG2008322.1 unnamed protein product [Fusarium graminearum]CEF73062.1 unnamed protein product [Fusarium graminearum]